MSMLEQGIGDFPAELGGGTFRDGSGSWKYVDGKKVRVPDQVPATGKPVRPAVYAVERDDGRRWPSAASAAADLKVSDSSVRRAARNGGTCLGHRFRRVGEPWKPAERRASHVNVRRREDGKTWPSIKACSRDTGLTVGSLGWWTKREGAAPDGNHYERIES